MSNGWENFRGREIGLKTRKETSPMWCRLREANNNGVFVTPSLHGEQYFSERFYPWGMIHYLGLRVTPQHMGEELNEDGQENGASQIPPGNR